MRIVSILMESVSIMLRTTEEHDNYKIENNKLEIQEGYLYEFIKIS